MQGQIDSLRQLYEQGRYREALEVARQVHELVRQHLGEAHPQFADGLNSLALLYKALGIWRTPPGGRRHPGQSGAAVLRDRKLRRGWPTPTAGTRDPPRSAR